MTRRATAAAVVATLSIGGASHAQPATQPDLPRLAGVVVSSEGRRAIFAGQDGSVTLAEGEWVGGYAVVAITPGAVRLQGPAGTYDLRPVPAPEPGTAAPAVLPGPVQADARQQAEADNNK